MEFDPQRGLVSRPEQEIAAHRRVLPVRECEFDVECHGEPDSSTGYLVNIVDIDRVVREHGPPILEAGELHDARWILLRLAEEVERDLGVSVSAIRLRLAHNASLTLERPSMSHIFRLSFEFAASHRLHASSLSDAENLRIFGKCNNPNGHGHNYRLEPEFEATSTSELRTSPRALRDLVGETIMEKFDHQNLNLDLPEFAELNPSVENIAKVIFDDLSKATADSNLEVSLRRITLWETSKTSCVYPA